MEMIRPSADIRNHYAEMSRACRENRTPIYITVNGRSDTVLLGVADFNQMKAELSLLRMLAEADEDVAEGRVAPIQESFLQLRAALAARKQE